MVIGGRNIWDSLGSGELEKDITSWLSLTWNTIVIRGVFTLYILTHMPQLQLIPHWLYQLLPADRL